MEFIKIPWVSFVLELSHVWVGVSEIRSGLTVAVNAAENKKAVEISPNTLQKFSYVMHDSPMVDNDNLLSLMVCIRK